LGFLIVMVVASLHSPGSMIPSILIGLVDAGTSMMSLLCPKECGIKITATKTKVTAGIT